MITSSYDIVILGAGHAGLEAAWAASQFGLKVAMLTMPGVPIASTPCNPSVGGVGKGQVVREIDALGGVMGKIADMAGIQYRTLNQSKGHAVHSTRVQVDKEIYSKTAEQLVSKRENIQVVRRKIDKISFDNGLFNLIDSQGDCYQCMKLVITTGTFLSGKLHVGEEQSLGGRVGAPASVGLQELLGLVKTLNLRFKTGTPPRIDKKTIDFSVMEKQDSDDLTPNFHFLHDSFKRFKTQSACYLTRTNDETLSIIRGNKDRSPMYNGQIKGIGPRYCPSIEDKAFRYLDRNSHHVFIEPEGLDLDTMYPSGISTSLPKDVQLDFVHTMKGLEKAEILVYGHAVEYDVVDTSYLDRTLQYRDIPGLYFAGQVNGTSGYEEAAGQGIMAGINASLAFLGQEALVLDRQDSYIGVMIDDLVSSQRDEPYRLFTARSENRLYLREDNCLVRMAPYRKHLNLEMEIDKALDEYLWQVKLLEDLCQKFVFKADKNELQRFLDNQYGPIESSLTLAELIKRPNLDPVVVLNQELLRANLSFDLRVVTTVAIGIKYEGYINRAKEETDRLAKLSRKSINWKELIESKNISHECRLRIARIRPETFGQLRMMEGIRPATLAYVAGNVL